MFDSREIKVSAGGVELEGFLSVPAGAVGIVVFVHGSGSSRFSARNRYVADALNEAGFASLLFDLLTADEHAVDEVTREYRFDIPRLTARLVSTIDWLRSNPETQSLAIGLFGSSTGAAAALIAASQRPEAVAAVVSRGGRPDLANAVLPEVVSPTLLIVGGLDGPVIGMNRHAADRLTCEHRIEIVPGATHLFGEPGKMERVIELATDWFNEKIG